MARRRTDPIPPDEDDAPPEPAVAMAAAAPEPAAPGEPGQRLIQASPKRIQSPRAAQELPEIARSVFVMVSTGARGKIDFVPVHEVPLLRRKIAAIEPAAEKPTILADWPGDHLPRTRGLTRVGVEAEITRLRALYVIDKPNGRDGEVLDLIAETYGTGQAMKRQLLQSMAQVHAGWLEISGSLGQDEAVSDEQVTELVGLADPDWDAATGGNGLLEYREFEPAGRGTVVTSDNTLALKA